LMSVIDERSGYRQSVVGQVSESTSGAQRVLGPLIVIPYVEREEKKDEKGQTVVQRVQYYRYLLPESLQVQGAPNVEVRKLGIY
ncbi:inner membrane CreD family protein, partial [Escherichia coli]|uniref:inner membrane CreD family protein n=2 Tax=Enterobacterales TaxID=91347 RepID=UPI0013D0953E